MIFIFGFTVPLKTYLNMNYASLSSISKHWKQTPGFVLIQPGWKLWFPSFYCCL